MDDKKDMTIYERAEVGERVVHKLRQTLKGKPADVIGHLESTAYCCRNGTVALVRLDLDSQPAPRQRTKKK